MSRHEPSLVIDSKALAALQSMAKGNAAMEWLLEQVIEKNARATLDERVLALTKEHGEHAVISAAARAEKTVHGRDIGYTVGPSGNVLTQCGCHNGGGCKWCVRGCSHGDSNGSERLVPVAVAEMAGKDARERFERKGAKA